MKIRLTIAGLLLSSCMSTTKIVDEKSIKQSQEATSSFQLDKNIPVTYREVPNSEILVVRYNIAYGIKDEANESKAVPGILFKSLPEGSSKFSKLDIYRNMEKYSSSISCSTGIEYSTCSLRTVNEYFHKTFPIFANIISEPKFDPKTLKVAKIQGEARISGQLQRPDFAVNESVNFLFYGEAHPYWISYDQRLKQFKNITSQSLLKKYASINREFNKHFTVVGSLPSTTLKKAMNKHFTLSQGKSHGIKVPAPGGKKGFESHFSHRKIPTAYIKIKTTMPGMREKDTTIANLMMKILDEKLSLEIRTRKSLSYSVYSYIINHSLGIGVIGTSTSYPKETMAAIASVVKQLKSEVMSQEELNRHKTVYATSYFLTLEEHSSLNSALDRYQYYFAEPDKLYTSVTDLQKVSPEDIQKAAQDYLVNMKVAVIFDKKKYKEEWANPLKDI